MSSIIPTPRTTSNAALWQWAKELTGYLRSVRLNGGHGIIVKQSDGGIVAEVSPGIAAAINEPISFDYAINQGPSTVTISKGKLLFHGVGFYSVVQAAVSITGGTAESPQWVIVRANKANPGGAALVNPALSTPPSMTSTSFWEFPLYTFYKNAGSIVLDYIWHRGANLELSAAIRPT